MGGGLLSFRTWWEDDFHTIPRWYRDLKGWMGGRDTTRVDLTTMTYDPVTGWEHMDTVRVALKDLPPEALHVSNKGYKAFVLDKDGAGEFPPAGTITAHDCYLFLKSDAIDVALKKRRTSILDMIDGKTFAIICGVVGALVVFYWWFM